MRMQLELLKPELVQQEQGVESTIVIFGSARIRPPEIAAEQLEQARAAGDPQALAQAETARCVARTTMQRNPARSSITLACR